MAHIRKPSEAGAVAARHEDQGWRNLPAQRQEKVTVVLSDRVEKGGHNIPPADARPQNR